MKNFTPTPLDTLIFWPATFAEILLRKDLGGDYLTQQSLKHLMVIFLVPIGDYFEPLVSTYSKGLIWFLILCAVRAIFELARVEVNKRKGLKIHSYSSGIPLDIWKLITKKQSIIRLLFEPTLIALIGIAFIATKWDVILGYALAAIALSLFWKELFYVKRTKTIKTAITNAKHRQEAITKGDPLTDYDPQPKNIAPNPDELTGGITDGVKNIGWKG